MAKPKIYMWTDPGAPQITLGNAAQYQALFQAVLIDGYGTKTPPGSGVNPWSMPYTDTNGFILKQGGSSEHKCCLRMAILSNDSADIQVAMDYNSWDEPVDLWAGHSRYERVGLGWASTDYNIPWIIFATERTILCQFGYNHQQTDVSVFDTTLNSNAFNYHWMFGDYAADDPQAVQNPHFIIGTEQSSDNSQFYRATIPSNAAGYTYKKCYTSIGGQTMVPLVTTPMGHSNDWVSRHSNGKPSYPNTLNGGLYLQKVKFMVRNNIIGNIPGIVFSAQERIPQMGGSIKTITGSGEFANSTLYVFNTYLGQYMVHDGEWGVE